VLRAIVVDNEANLRLLARYVLEDDGLAEVVGEACTANDAERMIRELAPDVAIIDIHLPDMSGIDLIERLRDRAVTIRLIAYSSDDLALADALRAGADTAVLKTGRSEELIAALVA
jgi:DNA-binding NarL/FixJ family response regulator